MNKIVFAIAILLCAAYANASDMNIVLCKEKNYQLPTGVNAREFGVTRTHS